MRDAVSRASEATSALTRDESLAAALTNAHDYLTVMGHTCVAWMWLRSASAAARGLRALDEASDSKPNPGLSPQSSPSSLGVSMAACGPLRTQQGAYATEKASGIHRGESQSQIPSPLPPTPSRTTVTTKRRASTEASCTRALSSSATSE